MFVEIEGYPGYLINHEGVIWSTKQGKVIKLKNHHSVDGYCKVKLFRPDGSTKCNMIHRLVMATFAGVSELPVNHKDGNKSNNCLDNLEYCTPSYNTQHAHATGLMNNMRKLASERQKRRVGEKNSNAALTDIQATSILRLKGTMYLKDAASQFNTTISVVHKLWKGKTYPHLSRTTHD